MNNKSDSALTNETLWQMFNKCFCFCFHCYHKLRFVEKKTILTVQIPKYYIYFIQALKLFVILYLNLFNTNKLNKMFCAKKAIFVCKNSFNVYKGC